MTDKQQNEIEEIEATQTALRDSIEQTKGLAAKVEDLLQQHKQNLETGAESGDGEARGQA